jgi:hypothetical protein
MVVMVRKYNESEVLYISTALHRYTGVSVAESDRKAYSVFKEPSRWGKRH